MDYSGNYVLNIYNPAAPSLVLSTDTFNLAVKPCKELNIFMINIVDKDCSEGYTIDLSNVQITGSSTPLTYILENDIYKERSTSEVSKIYRPENTS